MAGLRIIPRLDIKGPNLIKGIRLEGLRVVGDPHAFALRYYAQGWRWIHERDARGFHRGAMLAGVCDH